MNSLTAKSMKLARKTAQSGIDAAVTIAARTPGLVTSGLDASGEKATEARLMVQEKIDATFEGMWAAQMTWGNFLIKAAFGGVTTPTHVSHAMVDVAEAAMAPARRAVRANAKRLTGMKPFG